MRKGCVYKVVISGTDLVYIGSTLRGLKQRRSEHLHYLRNGNHFSSKFQEAFNLYGEENLKFHTIIDAVEKEFLVDMEQIEISKVSADFLLNSTNIAEPIYSAREVMLRTNAHQSDDVKAKRVESRRRSLEMGIWSPRVWSDEDRLKHSERLKGRKMPPISDTTKLKISQANKGRECPPLAIKNSVEKRTSFIKKEIDEWVKLKNSGCSYREIERITGRSRSVISREIKAVENA